MIEAREITTQEFAALALNFAHHPPGSDSEVELHEAIRDGARAFAGLLYQYIPPCRERSMALTHIEQAMMNANAAVARRLSAPKNKVKGPGDDGTEGNRGPRHGNGHPPDG